MKLKVLLGSDKIVVNLDGNMLVRDSAFNDCEKLVIDGYPYIERNAFSNENLKRISINGEEINFSDKTVLLNFFSFRNQYIIEYMESGTFKTKTFPKKVYDEIPNYEEIKNYNRCREKLFSEPVLNIMNKIHNSEYIEFDDIDINEIDLIIDKKAPVTLQELRKLVFLIRKARYTNNDFYGIENYNYKNGITPIEGNKYFKFIINQIFDRNSVLNRNKSEFLDFIYDLLEEYTYELSGTETNVCYLDILGGSKGAFDYVDDEIFLNKSSINKYDLDYAFFVIYHESSHSYQARAMDCNIMPYKYYVMIKEKCLEEYYSCNNDDNVTFSKEEVEFYDKNYEIELSELDADRSAREIYEKSLKLWGYTRDEIDDIVYDGEKSKLTEKDENIEVLSENKFFDQSIININEIFEKTLPRILQEAPDFFDESLLIEFNKDGKPKKKIEILSDFEKFISNDEKSKNEKRKGLDLYFGIMLKDNRLLNKNQILQELSEFSNFKSDNEIVEKIRIEYIENLKRLMYSLITNQLQEITESQMQEKDMLKWYLKLNSKRKKIRFKQMNSINQRIEDLKVQSGFEEDCK